LDGQIKMEKKDICSQICCNSNWLRGALLKWISDIISDKKKSYGNFSAALNAFGEMFVNNLLKESLEGRWWYDFEKEKFKNCKIIIKNESSTKKYRFIWNDILENPEEFDAERVKRVEAILKKDELAIGDGNTNPDHIITVETDEGEYKCMTEQKLRFSPKDISASPETIKQYVYPEKFEEKQNLKIILKDHLDPTKNPKGKTLQVAFYSMLSYNAVTLSPKKSKDQKSEGLVQCGYLGFLAPSIKEEKFKENNTIKKNCKEANLKLWIGLDSILEKSSDDYVSKAWTDAYISLLQKLKTVD